MPVTLSAYQGSRRNWVQYKGNYYSTLADVPVDTSYDWNENYQDFIDLPSGWIIAPDNADSNEVMRAHPWSAYYVYTQRSYRSSYGMSKSSLIKRGNQYKPMRSGSQILIMLQCPREKILTSPLLACAAPATKVFPAVSGFSASVSRNNWEINPQSQYEYVLYGGAAIGRLLDGTTTWMESRTVVMIYRFI